MISLRKKKSEKFYQEDVPEKGCFCCGWDMLVKEYKHWVVLNNKYPYDAIASKHDLICPKRHIVSRDELTTVELAELREIRKLNEKIYDFEMWSYPHRQTHPVHYHIHLIKFNK